jgi:hypothetical protein
MSMPIRDLRDLIPYAIKTTDTVLPCDFKLKINGMIFIVYEASITHRDILLFTNHGALSYAVDSYGDRHVIELIDWDLDDDLEKRWDMRRI